MLCAATLCDAMQLTAMSKADPQSIPCHFLIGTSILISRFIFANAPVDVRSAMSMTTLYAFAATYAMRRPVALNVRLTRQKPKDVLELSDLCVKHNVLDLYLWLSIRFPEFFVEREVCLEQKTFAIECIQSSLESPHLQHKFSHSNEYKAVRVKMLTGETLGLPSFNYGAVRESFVKNLALIDQKDLYVFPTLAEEAEPQTRTSSGNAGGTARDNSYKNPAEKMYRRNDVVRKVPPLPVGLRVSHSPDTQVAAPQAAPVRNVTDGKMYRLKTENSSTYDKITKTYVAGTLPLGKKPKFGGSRTSPRTSSGMYRGPNSSSDQSANQWVHVRPEDRIKNSKMNK